VTSRSPSLLIMASSPGNSNSRGIRTALFRPFLKTLTWRSGLVLARFDGTCQADAKGGDLSTLALQLVSPRRHGESKNWIPTGFVTIPNSQRLPPVGAVPRRNWGPASVGKSGQGNLVLSPRSRSTKPTTLKVALRLTIHRKRSALTENSPDCNQVSQIGC